MKTRGLSSVAMLVAVTSAFAPKAHAVTKDGLPEVGDSFKVHCEAGGIGLVGQLDGQFNVTAVGADPTKDPLTTDVFFSYIELDEGKDKKGEVKYDDKFKWEQKDGWPFGSSKPYLYGSSQLKWQPGKTLPLAESTEITAFFEPRDKKDPKKHDELVRAYLDNFGADKLQSFVVLKKDSFLGSSKTDTFKTGCRWQTIPKTAKPCKVITTAVAVMGGEPLRQRFTTCETYTSYGVSFPKEDLQHDYFHEHYDKPADPNTSDESLWAGAEISSKGLEGDAKTRVETAIAKVQGGLSVSDLGFVKSDIRDADILITGIEAFEVAFHAISAQVADGTSDQAKVRDLCVNGSANANRRFGRYFTADAGAAFQAVIAKLSTAKDPTVTDAELKTNLDNLGNLLGGKKNEFQTKTNDDLLGYLAPTTPAVASSGDGLMAVNGGPRMKGKIIEDLGEIAADAKALAKAARKLLTRE